MSSFDSYHHRTERPTSSPASEMPSACPACRSPSITTNAKNPDANTYWRCEACGEVWNAGRRQTWRPGGFR